MESFYGGRAGSSFVIVKSFESIADMVKSFSQGGSYTQVHYDEHVLINTVNKNDPDNGKVYRRGYDYTNDLGGGIYVGTIVGPAGRAPMLEITTIEQVKAKQNTEGYTDRYSEGSYSIPASLVPGKDGSKYNDIVEWACCCIRNSNNEDSIAYIGFKFPYLVNDFTAESVDPYYNRSNQTNNFVNQNLAARTDDKTHPFYEKWHFKIPKGIKGDAFKNFRVMPASTTIQDYTDRANDIAGIDGKTATPRQVLVYDYYHYDKNDTGEPVSIFLGDYNMIDDVSFDEEGTITIKYTHDNTDTYTKMLKWIKQVTLNSTTGKFTVEYNHSTDKNNKPTTYTTDLAWVKSVSIAENGNITLHYTGGKADETLTNTHLRWIKDIQMAANGTVTVTYNDNTTKVFDRNIQWISSITLAENGTFTVTYNNGAAPYTTTLTWVRDISIDNDGTVTITYNHGTPRVYSQMIKYISRVYFNKNGDNKFHVVYNNGSDEVVDNVIKFVDNMYMDENPNATDSTYGLHVRYNTGEDTVISKQLLNYIDDVVVDPTDYHLLVYYTNPNKRKTIPTAQKRTYNGKTEWLDLGTVKDEDGILIGFNIKPSDYPELNLGFGNTAEDIKFLNEQYPEGLEEPGFKGKVITIGEDGSNKLFYAFDYSTDNKGWFYLGTFDNPANVWTMVGEEKDPNIENEKRNLHNNGIWFVVEGEDD